MHMYNRSHFNILQDTKQVQNISHFELVSLSDEKYLQETNRITKYKIIILIFNYTVLLETKKCIN